MNSTAGLSESGGTLSLAERLVASASVWQLRGHECTEKITNVMEREPPGVFLVQYTEDQVTKLSLRLPDKQGAPLMHNVGVIGYKKFLHLEGSHLLFDDIFKLVTFYSVSRDILPVTLSLPKVISAATVEELVVISSKTSDGVDFWTSAPTCPAKDEFEDQDMDSDLNHSKRTQFCYINPVTVEEHMKTTEPSSIRPNSALSDVLHPSTSMSFISISQGNFLRPDSTPKPVDVSSSSAPTNKQGNLPSTTSHKLNLANGECVKTSEVRGNAELAPRFKRPPPRPPSLGLRLPSVFVPGANPPSLPKPVSEKKQEESAEEKGSERGGGSKEEQKSKLVSAPPTRPPVPSQSQAASRPAPTPLRRGASSRKSAKEEGDGDLGNATAERGSSPTQNVGREGGEKGKKGTYATPKGDLILHSSQDRESKDSPKQRGDEGHKREKEREEKLAKTEDEEVEKAQNEPDAGSCPLAKKPSRPVPPPRRKQPTQPPPPRPESGGVGSTNQCAGIRTAPPPVSRRPDVSLYSPQGGAVVGIEPDSCSTSSTEEEGEMSQEQEHNPSRSSECRNLKVAVKRTPTTVMLGRAKNRLSSVFTGLISHDRRFTQRIVELARDPLTYFGNLVKEHRAFTLETMSRHPSSTELLQEIRQMMTQLKSYLLQSTEMQSMMEPQHQYTQDKLETIVEAALCKGVLKPLREPIYRSLEKLHTEHGGLQQLAQNQSIVLSSTTTALGVTTAVPEVQAMEKIATKLTNLHMEYSPQRKIDLLLKTCKIIYDSMSVSGPGRTYGADDFLPVMMYVLARSNVANLQLDVEYMMELMDPSLTLGEGSYYLTTTYGALEHMKCFDQQRAATRQLSREVQDSIHRWERRRTLNKEHVAQGSIQDFLTVCCPDMGSNPSTLGVHPTTTIQELADQCAARFEKDSYMLSALVDGADRQLDPAELALGVKKCLPQGRYCFVFHPADATDLGLNEPQPDTGDDTSPSGVVVAEQEEEEESLISL